MVLDEAAPDDRPGAFMIAGMSWAILVEALNATPGLFAGAMGAYVLALLAEWKLGDLLATMDAGPGLTMAVGYGAVVIFLLVRSAVLATVAVAIHRLVLNSETSSRGASALFEPRTLRFLGWLWIVGLLCIVAGVPFALALFLPGIFGKLLFGAGFIAAAVTVNIRFSLALPTVAVELPAESAIARLRAAFDLSRGRSWRIVASILMTFVPLVLATFIVAALGGLFGLSPSGVAIFIVLAIGRVLTAGIGAAVLSWNYRIARVERGFER